MAGDVCFTVDVEWAHPEVLATLVAAFDERQLPATFFCTHPNIAVPGHERGLHPNFRRQGQPVQALRRRLGDEAFLALDDSQLVQLVLEEAKSFAPEARGLRTHSLFFASEYVSLYAGHGLVYDCSYLMHRVPGLQAGLREPGLALLPTFFMDHAELLRRQPSFRLEDLNLEAPGLKIFDFHPNMVFLNVQCDDHYQECRLHYHDVDWLRRNRRSGAGVGTFFLDVLDWAAARPERVSVAAQVAEECLNCW